MPDHFKPQRRGGAEKNQKKLCVSCASAVKFFLSFFLLPIFLLTLPLAAHAVDRDDTVTGTVEDDAAPPPPRTLSQLQHLKKENKDSSKSAMPFDLRKDAQKQAALSYGARGGLAWRTYHIRGELEARANYLDKVFDFRQLLIPAPSGLLIEPPVISEEVNATLIDQSGAEAAVADKIYDINKNAKIVSAPRSWRNYLERDWGGVTDPPDVLRPENPFEIKRWNDWVQDGWLLGIQQADSIFQDDLNQLTSDYQGMIRYRMLLAEGMVTPPYAQQVDRGVTGGGKNMRVGDRDVQITGMPGLVSGSEKWQPASR